MYWQGKIFFEIVFFFKVSYEGDYSLMLFGTLPSDDSISEINSDFCDCVSFIVFLLFSFYKYKDKNKGACTLFRTVSQADNYGSPNSN